MLGVAPFEPFCVAVTGVASRVARGSEEVASRFSFGVNRSVISTKSSSSSESGLAWPRSSGSSFLSVCQTPVGSMVTCSTLVDVECKMSSTYLDTRLDSMPFLGDENATHWSICNDSKLVDLLHTGQVHVGACSCN